jgi:Gas vesicle synthesis protein GvpL/GvpF
VIHVYALTEPARVLPDVRGIASRPVAQVVVGRVAAVVSRHEDAVEVEVSEESLWAHEAVVEALMADRAVLPVRFGGEFGEEGALRADLEPRLDELERALARLRGRVELGVRVLVRERAGAPASGRDYLLGRAEEQARASRIHERLAELAVESSVAPAARGDFLLTGSYLVERDDVAAFAAEVDRLAAEEPEVELLCTGPWPPYSFVDPAASGVAA